MTETDALSEVYARSLYELAQDAGGQEKIFEINDELAQVCELGRASRAFAEFLSSPIIDTARRGASLRSIFADRVTDLTLRFLLVLNQKGRLGRLESIAASFDRRLQEAFGRVEVDVTTPAPIDDATAARVEACVQTALGREPVLHRYVDPSMIGGIRLKIGDQLIDGSVARDLRRLRHDLLTSGGANVRQRFIDMVDDVPGDDGGAERKGS